MNQLTGYQYDLANAMVSRRDLTDKEINFLMDFKRKFLKSENASDLDFSEFQRILLKVVSI